ncbi:unnamed protein product, partial [Vitis vinifera]|uniref:Uncharacterized protein n=1 Tax=Vitis vinifera TaxID=29760 RepID=D7TBE5_VITVI
MGYQIDTERSIILKKKYNWEPPDMEQNWNEKFFCTSKDRAPNIIIHKKSVVPPPSNGPFSSCTPFFWSIISTQIPKLKENFPRKNEVCNQPPHLKIKAKICKMTQYLQDDKARIDMR